MNIADELYGSAIIEEFSIKMDCESLIVAIANKTHDHPTP